MTKKKLVEFIVSIEDPIGIGDNEYFNKIEVIFKDWV